VQAQHDELICQILERKIEIHTTVEFVKAVKP
jgi:hypothetical protein